MFIISEASLLIKFIRMKVCTLLGLRSFPSGYHSRLIRSICTKCPPEKFIETSLYCKDCDDVVPARFLTDKDPFTLFHM